MDLQPTTPIGSVLDLVGPGAIHILPQAQDRPATLTSPFTETGVASYMPQLMDYATVNPAATIPGRININQCSADGARRHSRHDVRYRRARSSPSARSIRPAPTRPPL